MLREVLIDDFEGSPRRQIGPLPPACFREEHGRAEVDFVPAERDGGGRAMHLRYQLPAGRDAEAGVRIGLGGLDASDLDHLGFWIRGDERSGYSKALRVGFKRPDPRRAGLVETGSHLVRGITGTWQRVVVPLPRLTGIQDWTNLDEFFISLHARRASPSEGAYYVDDIRLLKTGRPGPGAGDLVLPPRKADLKRSWGSSAQARLRARLNGWPERLRADRAELAGTDEQFLRRLAKDTWRGLDALSDREHGLPLDTVRFGAPSIDPADARIGDYTSTTNIGLDLIATVAAHELDLLTREEALRRLERTVATLERLESYRGFFFNFYDTTTLERTSNFISFVDSSWLTAGLMVVRMSFAELRDRCTHLIERGSYRFFYDEAERLMSHGYYVHLDSPSEYHYGVLFTESRLGSLIAIGRGDVPEEHWFEMTRTFPARCEWQNRAPRNVDSKIVRGHPVTNGEYRWGEFRYVPSWGGSMFEALMPTLVLDEQAHAAASLGANGAAHVQVQEAFARSELQYPVWGISPSANPRGGYAEYGVAVLGSAGYPAGAVTPHASALALGIAPAAATANLRALAQRYDLYGEYGFYDAVEPLSGAVAHAYLALDQAMILIALANHLKDHCIQRRFASDPIVQRALPVISAEHFLATADEREPKPASARAARPNGDS